MGFQLPSRLELYLEVIFLKRILLVMLWAYYDGSQKSNDPNCKAITLVGLAASVSVWSKFKPLWAEVLKNYGISAFHMTDAMSFYKEFKHWEEETRKPKRHQLIIDLLNVLGRFRSSENNLIAAGCTVLMEDYRKAQKQISGLRSPEAICVQICFNRLPCDIDVDGIDSDKPDIMLFFDRNEKFLRTIDKTWRKYPIQEGCGWPEQVKNISEVNSAECLPVQAADLLAWILNKKHNRDERSQYEGGLPLLVNLHYVVCNYEEIRTRFPNG